MKYAGVPVFNHSNFVDSYKISTVDNSTSCQFSLNPSLSMFVTNTSSEYNLDVNKNSTYFIMAVGKLNNGQILMHDDQDKTSSSINFSDHNKYANHTSGGNSTTDIDIFYEHCKDDKNYGCFTSPATGCVDNKTCKFGATWTGTSETKYQVQLMASTGVSSDYFVAMGLNTASASMGPAPVIACSQQFKQQPAVYFNFANHSGTFF